MADAPRKYLKRRTDRSAVVIGERGPYKTLFRVGAPLDGAREVLMADAPRKYPKRRTDELHKGRVSVPGARYFVTFVTEDRVPCLREQSVVQAVLTTLISWHEEHDGVILCATVMPDHVHVLFELGHRLTAGQCVGRWKSEIRRAQRYAFTWQRDFFEHRLLPKESSEDYGLYVFLNPYRAGLGDPDAVWPFGLTPDPLRFRFLSLRNPNGSPPREWLGWTEDRFAHLSIGE